MAVIGYQKSEEAEADFLADIAEKVYYIPMYKEPVEVSEKIQLVREVPKEITGGMKADVLVTNANSYPVDCVFILRESVSPKNLVPGLQMDGNHVAVNLQMETNVPGCFACGTSPDGLTSISSPLDREILRRCLPFPIWTRSVAAKNPQTHDFAVTKLQNRNIN